MINVVNENGTCCPMIGQFCQAVLDGLADGEKDKQMAGALRLAEVVYGIPPGRLRIEKTPVVRLGQGAFRRDYHKV